MLSASRTMLTRLSGTAMVLGTASGLTYALAARVLLYKQRAV